MITNRIDRIEVLENGSINVRELQFDATEVGDKQSTYKRWTLEPGQDVSSQPLEVQEVCAQAWTQEVVEKFNTPVKLAPFSEILQ